MRSFMQSFLDDERQAPAAQSSSMVVLGNPATMLPTNAMTDLATTSMQPVPSNPASPMQALPMAPLAVVNPNAYRSGLDVTGGRFDNSQPEDLTEIDDVRYEYSPGVQGLGAETGISKNMIILGIIGVAAAWYFSQKKGRRA